MEKQAIIKPGITPDLEEEQEKQAKDLPEEAQIQRLEKQDPVIKCGRCMGKSIYWGKIKPPPFAG